MNLKDYLGDPRLNELRAKMGAEKLGSFSTNSSGIRLSALDLEALIGTGIDVEDLSELEALLDHTITYKGTRVILYIRDIPEPQGEIEPSNLPKFHIANCSTLQKMRSQRRYGRYVVAARDDGLFHVHFKNEVGAIRKSMERLNVCKNCLKEISFNGYHPSLPQQRKAEVVNAFTIAEFFKRWPRDLVSGAGVASA